jgi:very-short-patch-repair endonuclease
VVLARNRPCRGAARLADLVADETAMAISRSRAEKALLRLIRDAQLPRPQTNVKFGRFEADFVWRKERLIVELDSPTFHAGRGSSSATARKTSSTGTPGSTSSASPAGTSSTNPR